ncbi:MAG: hypothetical protein K2Y71_29675 [Xanthobacteraceae bacterium]|nr:hypothetical protein [Xanthobacteraceae bacterium]
MRMITMLAAAMLLSVAAGSAQDVAGVEDCTKTQGLDKRTGCMQSNVNFLQRTITRNQLDAHRRLQAAETELMALRSALGAMRKQVDELQAAKSAAGKSAADKAAPDKKAEDKKK